MALCCWAAPHSLCGGGQSREHLIPRGVFNQDHVFVQGLPWCAEAEQRIGLSSVTAKILCRHHNSAMSVLDDAAIHAVRSFEQPCSGATPISGLLFERWLLKTTINLFFKRPFHIGVGIKGSAPGHPSAYLLDVVFGRTTFTHHMGLYLLLPQGPYRFKQGEITICPLIKGETIGGIYFGLRGIDLFLSLFPGAAPSTLASTGLTQLPEHVLHAQPVYRPTVLTTTTQSIHKFDIKAG